MSVRKTTKQSAAKRAYPPSRKPPRLNTGTRVMRELSKQGLTVRRLVTHPDGSVEYEIAGPGSEGQQGKPNEWDNL